MMVKVPRVFSIAFHPAGRSNSMFLKLGEQLNFTVVRLPRVNSLTALKSKFWISNSSSPSTA